MGHSLVPSVIYLQNNSRIWILHHCVQQLLLNLSAQVQSKSDFPFPSSEVAKLPCQEPFINHEHLFSTTFTNCINISASYTSFIDLSIHSAFYYEQIVAFWSPLWLSSSQGSSIFFNIHERKRESLGSNIMWQMLAWCHEREAVNNHRFRIGPPTSVYQTQLFEAFKDVTTLAWRPYLPSMSNWSTWKYGLPTRNFHDPPPFLPLYMGPTSLTWHWIPGSPLFLSCTLKKIGDEATSWSHEVISIGVIYILNTFFM